MARQLVENKRPKPLAGLALVVIVLALVYTSSILFAYLYSINLLPRIAADVGMWASGGAIALYLVWKYVLKYEYETDGVKLTVSRCYGHRPRYMAHVMYREIIVFAPLKEIAGKNPELRPQSALRKDGGFEKMALLYAREGEKKLLVIQPDEAILSDIAARVK